MQNFYLNNKIKSQNYLRHFHTICTQLGVNSFVDCTHIVGQLIQIP